MPRSIFYATQLLCWLFFYPATFTSFSEVVLCQSSKHNERKMILTLKAVHLVTSKANTLFGTKSCVSLHVLNTWVYCQRWVFDSYLITSRRVCLLVCHSQNQSGRKQGGVQLVHSTILNFVVHHSITPKRGKKQHVHPCLCVKSLVSSKRHGTHFASQHRYHWKEAH